jgi:hypothetical protein
LFPVVLDVDVDVCTNLLESWIIDRNAILK